MGWCRFPLLFRRFATDPAQNRPRASAPQPPVRPGPAARIPRTSRDNFIKLEHAPGNTDQGGVAIGVWCSVGLIAALTLGHGWAAAHPVTVIVIPGAGLIWQNTPLPLTRLHAGDLVKLEYTELNNMNVVTTLTMTGMAGHHM